jgi:hypothetical protein
MKLSLVLKSSYVVTIRIGSGLSRKFDTEQEIEELVSKLKPYINLIIVGDALCEAKNCKERK